MIWKSKFKSKVGQPCSRDRGSAISRLDAEWVTEYPSPYTLLWPLSAIDLVLADRSHGIHVSVRHPGSLNTWHPQRLHGKSLSMKMIVSPHSSSYTLVPFRTKISLRKIIFSIYAEWVKKITRTSSSPIATKFFVPEMKNSVNIFVNVLNVAVSRAKCTSCFSYTASSD